MENKVIVVDIGSSSIKAGFGGDADNLSVVSSVVGHHKVDREKVYFGESVLSDSCHLSIHFPVENGIITDFYHFEELMNYIFKDELKIDPTDCSILVVEPSLNPKPNREKTIQFLFETYKFNSYYTVNQGVASLYSVGKETGLAVECGGNLTQITPVYEGHNIHHYSKCIKLAGNEMDLYMKEMINQELSDYKLSSALQICRDIKEKHSYVALDFDAELAKAKSANCISIDYTMPSCTEIKLSEELFRCPEILFQPQLNGINKKGIDQEIYDTIMDCDKMIQEDMFKNIVITGGSTKIKGFVERIEKEIRAKAPESTEINVRAEKDRNYGAWNGASILSQLDYFESICITKEEYDDIGNDIVHIKCI